MPGQWTVVPGATVLLRHLHGRGVRTALLSNIALAPRPRLAQLGLLPHLDAVVLSYEEGLTKPDAALFERTLDRIAVPAHECVMVGDSPMVDGGASAAGITSVIVPIIGGRPDLGLVTQLLTR